MMNRCKGGRFSHPRSAFNVFTLTLTLLVALVGLADDPQDAVAADNNTMLKDAFDA